MVPIAGIGPATSPLPRECSTTEPNGHEEKPGFPSKILTAPSMKMERGRRIELLALAWKAKVLPLYEPRVTLTPRRASTMACPARYLCKLLHWWRGLDSNQRTRKRADLQSAAINHSATSPNVNPELCHEVRYGPQLSLGYPALEIGVRHASKLNRRLPERLKPGLRLRKVIAS